MQNFHRTVLQLWHRLQPIQPFYWNHSTIFQQFSQQYFCVFTCQPISCTLIPENAVNYYLSFAWRYHSTIFQWFGPFLLNFPVFEKLKVLSAMSLTVALTMKTNTPVFSIGFQYIRQLAKFGWKEAISYPKVANLSVEKRYRKGVFETFFECEKYDESNGNQLILQIKQILVCTFVLN